MGAWVCGCVYTPAWTQCGGCGSTSAQLHSAHSLAPHFCGVTTAPTTTRPHRSECGVAPLSCSPPCFPRSSLSILNRRTVRKRKKNIPCPWRKNSRYGPLQNSEGPPTPHRIPVTSIYSEECGLTVQKDQHERLRCHWTRVCVMYMCVQINHHTRSRPFVRPSQKPINEGGAIIPSRKCDSHAIVRCWRSMLDESRLPSA